MNGGGKKSAHKPKFPELPPKYSVSREWRNKAEKLRRNRLNGYLQDAKSLVPITANKTKKCEITRTNVLRAAASYIRIDHMYPSSSSSDAPAQIQKANNHVEAMKGVVFLLSQCAKVLFIGEKTEQYVGYTQLDLMGMNLLDFIHPGDKAKVLRNLQRKVEAPGEEGNTNSLLSIQHQPADAPGDSSSSGPSTSKQPPSSSHSQQKSDKNDDRRRSFYMRMREKPQSKNERPKYEHMHVIGHVRDATESEKKMTKDLEYVFVGMMKTVKDRPIFNLNLMEAVQDQYITRHLPDGRIIFCDHRISTIAGYMPDEVRGQSAFNYMFGEDLPWTTLALRTMFASSTGEGLVIYRLKTALGGLITLQSRGFLELNKYDKRIEHFVCINTLLKPEEGEKHLEKQRERFTPMITDLHNYGIDSLENLSELNQPTGSVASNPLKRKSRDMSNLPSKYLALESSDREITSSTPGTCIRLVRSSNGSKIVVNGGRDFHEASRFSEVENNVVNGSSSSQPLVAPSSAGNQTQTQNHTTSGNTAGEVGDSTELVRLLQELDSDDIVNTLRLSGLDTADTAPGPNGQLVHKSANAAGAIPNGAMQGGAMAGGAILSGVVTGTQPNHSSGTMTGAESDRIGQLVNNQVGETSRSIIVTQFDNASTNQTRQTQQNVKFGGTKGETSRVIVSHTPVISRTGCAPHKQDFNKNFSAASQADSRGSAGHHSSSAGHHSSSTGHHSSSAGHHSSSAGHHSSSAGHHSSSAGHHSSSAGHHSSSAGHHSTSNFGTVLRSPAGDVTRNPSAGNAVLPDFQTSPLTQTDMHCASQREPGQSYSLSADHLNLMNRESNQPEYPQHDQHLESHHERSVINSGGPVCQMMSQHGMVITEPHFSIPDFSTMEDLVNDATDADGPNNTANFIDSANSNL